MAPLLLTWAVEEDEWSVNPGNQRTGGWVRPIAGLQVVKRKACPCQESNLDIP